MSTISVDVSSSRIPVLQVGYQGENEVTDVLFDISSWIEEYGSGTAQIRVKRPQNSEDESYLLSLPIVDGVATWTVSELDTANKGNGKAQLNYLVGSAIKDSVIYPFKVGKSLVGSDSPVDPFDSWIERAKAWGTGELLDGDPVPSTDETYHNNSKYYSEQADELGAAQVALAAEQVELAEGQVELATAQVASAKGYAEDAEDSADLAQSYAHQFVGAPRAAAAAADMTDTSKIYVFTGTTTSSFTNGHWYYHNGSAWTDGGVYNSTAFTTDTTLAVSGAAADSKTVGDKVTDLKSALDLVGDFELTNLLDPNNIQIGKYCNNSNLNISNSALYNLAIVPVLEGETYTVKYGNTPRVPSSPLKFRFVCFANDLMAGGFPVLDGDTAGVTSNGEFTVPIGASYAYITTFADYGSDLMVLHGNIGGGYIPYIQYGPTFKSKIQRNDIVDFSTTGKNLVDMSNSVIGYLVGTGSINSGGTQYKTTDYIPVENGVTYTLSPRTRMLGVYGPYKNFLSYDNTEKNTPYQFTATADGYIRASYYDTDNYMIERGATATPFESYKKVYNTGYLLNDDQLEQVNSETGILVNKKWAVCGDSFTAGATNTTIPNGKYSGEKYVYPYLIGNRTGLNILKFFQSGRTLAYPADGTETNSLTNPSATYYYQNIPADVDYITIYLGINDGNHNTDPEDAGYIPLGTINDNTTNTYFGAWNVVLSWLRENRPFAHIGIIISNGCKNIDWVNAQIAVAKKYGIPYLNLNGDQFTPSMIRSWNNDLNDSIKLIIDQNQAVDYPSNTHPNDNAHQLESTFIEAFLKRL